MLNWLRSFILGKPINPLNPKSRESIALVAMLAWIGLGADALSSSCYGPPQAYIALGQYSHLAVYVAAFTVITVFIIAMGYNQVIELFPNGGGGYQVASKLLHPYAGLVAGSALLVDYVLTITVSIASGADAVFSFLPIYILPYKLYVEAATIVFLMALNLRGMKETIKVLMPIFLGFIATHVGLIFYGIISHHQGLSFVIPATVNESLSLAKAIGWFGVIGLTLHAYSLGSGTYTGLEAISNNVQRLSEPRIQTGKRTMLYMAISLSFMAGGLILLYLLWEAQPVLGKTLNATVFQSILGNSWMGQSLLVLTLELEAGLLLIAANTGFAAGPYVLANMASDNWLPTRFRSLSSRMVVQNGVALFGVAAIGALIWTRGDVSTLVLLYSINVFITFTLSLLGISVYWIKQRGIAPWKWHFLLSACACCVTTMILLITLYYKFASGGWLTLGVTCIVVVLCILIKSHYESLANKIAALDTLLVKPVEISAVKPRVINPQLPTAIIFINNYSVGMHTLLSVLRLFPHQFKNFIFISVGIVDLESFSGQAELDKMQSRVNTMLDYFVKYCLQYELPAESYSGFGIDPVHELERLADEVGSRYPHGIFFASRVVFTKETFLTRILHNQTPLLLQNYLHFHGKELMILPMKV
jgi:amino acid transporter